MNQLSAASSQQPAAQPARLARVADWEHRLLAYIEDAAGKPFKWGEHDCVLFACSWMRLAVEAEGPAARVLEDLKGSYDSAVSAARVMRGICGDGAGVAELAAHFATLWSLKELPGPLFAGRGDVVLLAHALCGDAGAPDPRVGPALGVVGSDGWHVYAPGPSGLAQATLKDCVKGWRI